MVQVEYSQSDGHSSSESAILLEIWEGGALVQTSLPSAKGASIIVVVNKQMEIAAEVCKCEQDGEYGYLLQIEVQTPKQWFPLGYVPEWHHSSAVYAESAGFTTTPGGFVC
jgi:hypothetical protein